MNETGERAGTTAGTARSGRTTAQQGAVRPRAALFAILALGTLPATSLAGDLSKYRDFQLGTDLPTIAKQTGTSGSQAKTIHRRPTVIQELEWRPQPLGWSSRTEPDREVVFSFYNGELFRITVNYDRYETEGLTSSDLIGALSAVYGRAVTPPAFAATVLGRYGNPEEVLARWQDAQHRFELVHSPYGPSFRLVGTLKRLEGPFRVALLEAKRLDDQEAPQREAERKATEETEAQAKLEKARLLNKPKFRP